MTRACLPRLELYHSRFRGPHVAMVLASMRAGNTRGDLWDIPQADRSPLLLLSNKANNVLYFEGELATNASTDSLAKIVATRVRPEAVAAGRSSEETARFLRGLNRE